MVRGSNVTALLAGEIKAVDIVKILLFIHLFVFDGANIWCIPHNFSGLIKIFFISPLKYRTILNLRAKKISEKVPEMY